MLLHIDEPTIRLKIGISRCLLGEKVRYNGEHKRLPFAVDTIKPYADFYSICPEVEVGLPIPRPTIGLYQVDELPIVVKFNDKHINVDINSKLEKFCQHKVEQLGHLCGYIVCAKSPSCGLGTTKVHRNDDIIAMTDGKFTHFLRQQYPWLPIEDNINLTDADCQTHFVIRMYALQRLNQLKAEGLTRHGLIDFHSRYKLLLLAHSQPLYRALGRFVAQLDQCQDLDHYFVQYRERLMQLLQVPASVANHTNVLMHMQGYFNTFLSSSQKQDLTNTILKYRQGELPLKAPIDSLQTCLQQYPNDYLSRQFYFSHYPQPFKDQSPSILP